MKGNSISKSAMWVLMGLLILGLGGFGVTNLSGNIRTVGSVGNAEISLNDYARGLQNEIRALEAERGSAVSFAQARAAQVDQRVLARLVAEAALDHETAQMGLSIGDRNLRDQILDIPGFRGIDGEFDREAYAFALDQAGVSEAAFEEDMRAEAARALLQGAIVSGVAAPATYTETLLDYIAEQRDVTFARLTRGDLATGLPVPSDADLRRYYEDNIDDFTTPETRSITYAWLAPEMIIDTVEVDEASLREAYEARLDAYNQPERRLVERLGFADDAAAEAARAEIEAGNKRFEEYVTERGLDLTDVDLGDVTPGDLGSAGEAVFAAEEGSIVGPLDSPIGPALFRVNAVLAAQQVSFEEALPDLREALAGDRARRQVDAQIDRVDDLLAGGATLEQVAGETELELGTVDWHPGMSEGISAYAGFRRAAAEVSEDDFPEVGTLEDSTIFALRLDGTRPPEAQPLDEVREAVRAAWQSDAVTSALRTQARDQVSALQSGQTFEDAGLRPETATGLTRTGFHPDTPPDFLEAVFELEPGRITLVDGNEQLFIVRLDRITPPSDANEDVAQLGQALQDQAANDIAQDLYQVLAEDIRARAGIVLDQQALNAVHANFQ